MPYWLNDTLQILPLTLWMFFGVGIPYALLLLPRTEWYLRANVALLAIISGSALTTAWLLFLGVLGAQLDSSLLRFDLAFIGTVTLAGIGYAFAWRKHKQPYTPRQSEPLDFEAYLIIALLIIAVILRWITTSYWSFTAYDALWVYGYQPRLYFLTGMIPNTIDYYPQYLQLQYTFMQLGGGEINDHYARSVIPFLHVGSLLAVYTLGSRLVSRRVGLIAMAIWGFYPHLSDWAHIGDLEVPTTLLFTATATFFLQAWMHSDKSLRRRYSLIAGLIFGVAMFTKPTAGAFIWGVVLLVGIEFTRQQFNWKSFYPRFEVAFITGLACIPLGSIWYIRNGLLGHDLIRLPHFSWLDRATRSGDMFGWWLLLIGVICIFMLIRRVRINWIIVFIGIILILVGLAPSMPLINPDRINPPESRLTLQEIIFAFIGLTLVLGIWWRAWRSSEHTSNYSYVLELLIWSQLLALPYFFTWFYSYSYHARLSFPMVPLLILPTAYIIAQIIPQTSIQMLTQFPKFAYAGIIVAISSIGIVTNPFAPTGNLEWLTNDPYPNVFEKYRVHNPGITLVHDYLSGYIRETGQDAIVIAPGVQRLNFFFPLMDIRTDVLPTRIDELDGVTHFLYGAHARWRYEDESIMVQDNQLVSALARQELFDLLIRFTDGIFRYELYTLDLIQRELARDDLELVNAVDAPVIFDDRIEYYGHSVSNTQFARGNAVFMDLFFRVLAPINEDLTMQFHLVNVDDGQTYGTWDTKPLIGEHGTYTTNFWEVGEVIKISRKLEFTDDMPDAPIGDYRLVIGFYTDEGENVIYLPVTVDDISVEQYEMEENFRWG